MGKGHIRTQTLKKPDKAECLSGDKSIYKNVFMKRVTKI
jgi:hypothetical protein